MDVRFGRWWRRRPDAEREAMCESEAADAAEPPAITIEHEYVADCSDLADAPRDRQATTMPEQPVLIPPPSSRLPSRIGVVLPSTRFGRLPRLLPIPRVPKRTVLAIGVCAGLAAPVVGRQLAIQALLALLGQGRVGQGRATRPLEGATVEIIRVHYAGSAAGHAASAVTKILEQVRR